MEGFVPAHNSWVSIHAYGLQVTSYPTDRPSPSSSRPRKTSTESIRAIQVNLNGQQERLPEKFRAAVSIATSRYTQAIDIVRDFICVRSRCAASHGPCSQAASRELEQPPDHQEAVRQRASLTIGIDIKPFLKASIRSAISSGV